MSDLPPREKNRGLVLGRGDGVTTKGPTPEDEEMAVAQNPPIQAAATVMVLRSGVDKPEVLLVQRSQRLVFGPGHWVFPGGRLDPADYLAAGSTEQWSAARYAAVREAWEETRLSLPTALLTPLSIWVTPLGPPRRFRAFFFVCVTDEAQPVQVDGEEIVDYRWVTAAEALAAFDEGDLPLMLPTQQTLLHFLGCNSAEDGQALCRAGKIEEFVG